MFCTYPATSPTFVILIVYRIMTVALFNSLAGISTFTRFWSLYPYCVVLLLVCTITSLTYLSNSKSNVEASINPISILVIFPEFTLITSVAPSVLLVPSIVTFLLITSEFWLSSTPSFLYSVRLYLPVSYANTNI